MKYDYIIIIIIIYVNITSLNLTQRVPFLVQHHHI